MWDFLSKAGNSVMDSISNAGSAVGEGLSTVGEYAGAGLSHVAERLQDEDFQQQARLFSAAMSDDNNRYQAALNAYDQRKAEIAKQKREDMQRAEARQQKLADLKEQRQYNETNDWLKSYTPESVAQFRQTGDKSVLVSDTVTEMVYDNGIQYQVTKDLATNKEVGRTRATPHEKAAKARTQTINNQLYVEQADGSWKLAVDGRGDGSDNGEVKIQFSSGGKPQEAGFNGNGEVFYMTNNPKYVANSYGEIIPIEEATGGFDGLDRLNPKDRQVLDEKAYTSSQEYQELDSVLGSMEQTLNDLVTAPGYESIYGAIDGRLPNLLPDAVDAEAYRDKLSGELYLSQRQKLKGQGAITEQEANMAAKAATILTNPKASTEARKKAEEQLREVIRKGRERVATNQTWDGKPMYHTQSNSPARTNNRRKGGQTLDKSQVQIRRN